MYVPAIVGSIAGGFTSFLKLFVTENFHTKHISVKPHSLCPRTWNFKDPVESLSAARHYLLWKKLQFESGGPDIGERHNNEFSDQPGPKLHCCYLSSSFSSSAQISEVIEKVNSWFSSVPEPG